MQRTAPGAPEATSTTGTVPENQPPNFVVRRLRNASGSALVSTILNQLIVWPIAGGGVPPQEDPLFWAFPLFGFVAGLFFRPEKA
jgi:hypothetical protein